MIPESLFSLAFQLPFNKSAGRAVRERLYFHQPNPRYPPTDAAPFDVVFSFRHVGYPFPFVPRIVPVSRLRGPVAQSRAPLSTYRKGILAIASPFQWVVLIPVQLPGSPISRHLATRESFGPVKGGAII